MVGIDFAPSPEKAPQKSLWSRWFVRAGLAAGALVLVAGVATLLILLLGRPTASISASSPALFKVDLGGLDTQLDAVEATSGDHPVALVETDGKLVPTSQIGQGEQIRVTATVSAPSWLRWLMGPKITVSKTLRTPSASPSAKIALASSPGHVPVDFDYPVSVVDYRVDGGPSHVARLGSPSEVAELSVPSRFAAGSLQVAAAPLEWERIDSHSTTISWFVPPASGAPVALVEPTPGSGTAPTNSPITMTFDEPISKLFGSSRPAISPKIAGTWSQPDPNTLIFTPSGFGFGPGAAVTVAFGKPVSTIGASEVNAETAATTSESFSFDVAPGSYLRMDQILAQLHYLPLNFTPAAGVSEPTTFDAEVDSMSQPLAGTFTWRWSSTPGALQDQWSAGSPNTMLKGALMSFLANVEGNNYDGYQVDDESAAQLANASLWEALLRAALADQVDPNPYSYVYVSENLPETLTIWEDGSVVLTAPCNTGIPVDPTALGTYPIYVRYTFNYMSGFNPDGSYYHDPVYWINYFNGGDAVHGFVRGSYGFPQSLGCVELPIPTAQVAFGHLSIGDLVTVAA